MLKRWINRMTDETYREPLTYRVMQLDERGHLRTTATGTLPTS